MPTVSVYVPEDLYRKMKQHKEIKWSTIIRQAIQRFLKELEEADYRLYVLQRLAEEGEDAEELFEI